MRPFSRSTENSYAFTEEPPSWELLFSIFTKVAGLESITAVLLKIDLPTEFFSYVLFKVALFQHFGKCSVKYHFNISMPMPMPMLMPMLKFPNGYHKDTRVSLTHHWRRSSVFTVIFVHIRHFFLMFLLLTLSRCIFAEYVLQ